MWQLLTDWYARNQRDLPWRRPDAGPWAVLVSEVMLQQTPVARVLPVYDAWLARWPTPADLAADSPGEAVRMWDRLGYPRRALRLHEAARTVVAEHGGAVPDDLPALLALPGLGAYTARAVAAFAHGRRVAVLDTNVRRVLARWWDGLADAPGRSPTTTDIRRLENALPGEPDSVTASVALMELGALVCTARRPKCHTCPLMDECAWRAAGFPASDTPRRVQTYAGTDRQVRGRLLALLRASAEPLSAADLRGVWDDDVQRDRALATLLDDGLVVRHADGSYALPGSETVVAV